MSSILIKEKDIKTEKLANSSLDQGTSYEVFRNNTTAVEVVVKDVLKGSRKKSLDFEDLKLNRFQADVDKLHVVLDSKNKVLEKTRKSFHTIIREMKKLLQASYSREAEAQAANLALKLENERLQILLESKTKLVTKSKKELCVLKRVLKSTVKNISNTPEIPGQFEITSDTDYEDFESELRSNTQTALKSGKPQNKMDTFDTTFSVKDNCFEKRE